MSRTCAVIEYLSNSPRSEESSQANTTLSVKSRFGANLIMDAVFRARDRFSQSVKDQRPPDYTQAAAQENLVNSVMNQMPAVISDFDVGASNLDWDAIFYDMCV